MKLIWAQDSAGGIGADNALPWHLPEDLRFFKETTRGSAIIMGRNTFDSLPGMLPGREHHVITSRPQELPSGVRTHSSVEEALSSAPEGWIIGGASIYGYALSLADTIVRTLIYATFACDAFAPDLPARFHLEGRSDLRYSSEGLPYRFERWKS